MGNQEAEETNMKVKGGNIMRLKGGKHNMKIKKDILKKGLVLATICLFIGGSVVPHITINVEASDEDGLVAY